MKIKQTNNNHFTDGRGCWTELCTSTPSSHMGELSLAFFLSVREGGFFQFCFLFQLQCCIMLLEINDAHISQHSITIWNNRGICDSKAQSLNPWEVIKELSSAAVSMKMKTKFFGFIFISLFFPEVFTSVNLQAGA